MNTLESFSSAIAARTPRPERASTKADLQAALAAKNEAIAEGKKLVDGAKSSGIGLTAREQDRFNELMALADAKQAEADIIRADIERIDTNGATSLPDYSKYPPSYKAAQSPKDLSNGLLWQPASDRRHNGPCRRPSGGFTGYVPLS